MIDNERMVLTHRRFRYIYGRLCDLAKEANPSSLDHYNYDWVSAQVTIPTLSVNGRIVHESITFYYDKNSEQGRAFSSYLREEFRPMWREYVDLLDGI